MSNVAQAQEIQKLGREFGRELAAALVLASEQAGDDRNLTRQMARLVLLQIEGAVRKLRDAAFPRDLLAVYEKACREGVHAELTTRGTVTELTRRAA